jgi:hypothetical protein
MPSRTAKKSTGVRCHPTKERPKLLLVISDIHCGSDTALAPPVVKLRAGNHVTPGENLHQRWLWHEYQRCLDRFFEYAKGDPFCAVFNGDICEGVHHGTTELIELEKERHLGIAVEATRQIWEKATRSYVVEGTQCHTGHLEHLFAEMIGAEKPADSPDGHYAPHKWLFEMHGCLVDATHHMPATSRAYLEAGAMSITRGNALLNAVRAGHRPAQVYLRGHRHVPGIYSDHHSLFGVTGAWQFLTRHGRKVVPDSVPCPTILILDWRNVGHGELPAILPLKAIPPQQHIPQA